MNDTGTAPHYSDYDVVIMGGGPAGSTLAARLVRETSLKVAIFEKEQFPREHIGESFSSLVVPCLQQAGVLERVLASECYVKKYGGFYAWGGDEPATAFFKHHLWEQDGHHRWSMHVNRSEFDHLLLQHARESGVDVFEGVAVSRFERSGGTSHVELGDGGRVACRFFVDASGRWNQVNSSNQRVFLSQYRNIAVWGHFRGGRPAQELSGDWNIFRQPDLSCIGSFAFEDGWCWYIPVRRHVAGRRVTTHSLGVVTDPRVLREKGLDLRRMDVFLDVVRRVPLLAELTTDIDPICDELQTATNYSMISERMCDFDEGWIRIGDAAYFVDPLFSSGVNFALIHAGLAAELIRATIDPAINSLAKRHLWQDFHEFLGRVARAFALAIDQWYSGIAEGNPGSIYWRERAQAPTFESRKENFHALLNSDLEGDLLRVITRGTSDLATLGDGALTQGYRELAGLQIAPEARVQLYPDVMVTESMTLEPLAAEAPGETVRPSPLAHGPYWEDPVGHGGETSPIIPRPSGCHRFFSAADPVSRQVRFVPEIDGGLDLYRLLRQPQLYRDLEPGLTSPQKHLLRQMLLVDMLMIETPSHPTITSEA